MSELNFLSAIEIVEGIRAGKFSPVELPDAHIARIELSNPKLNAFVHSDFASAREQARAAEAAANLARDNSSKFDALGALRKLHASTRCRLWGDRRNNTT